jgi:hypothetical protein
MEEKTWNLMGFTIGLYWDYNGIIMGKYRTPSTSGGGFNVFVCWEYQALNGLDCCSNTWITWINGNFRILKWRYVSTIFLAIFSGDIPLHRPKK